tara:strand:+ start:1189 stop:1620 length:432 start_codon:yes stop_codon:yes gene_type:complete
VNISRRHDDLDRICEGCNPRGMKWGGLKPPYGWKAKWVINCPHMSIVDSKRCGRCRNRIKGIAYIDLIKEENDREYWDDISSLRNMCAQQQGIEPYQVNLPRDEMKAIHGVWERKLKAEIKDVELHIKDGDYKDHYQYWEEKL